MVKNPCQGCVYFAVCGSSSTSTEPCTGGITKRQQKKAKEKK